MRFTISSTLLSSNLSALSKVINSGKNTLSILDNFLFDLSDGRLTVVASDGDNTLRAIMSLDESDGSTMKVAIPSRTALEAVKELPDQPLVFDIDESTYNVRVTYQNGVYNFSALDGSDFPLPVTVGEDSNTITLSSQLLCDNISRSLFATAQEELRPVMNGIYFDLNAESLSIVATDGRKLVRNRVTSIKSEQPAAFILPKKPATLLKNVLHRDDSEVVIRFDRRSATISYPSGTLSCRLIDGRYPNYNAVIPQNNPNRVQIDSKSLSSALRRILPFASAGSQLVKFHFENGRVSLSSEDLEFSTSAHEDVLCDYSGLILNIGFKGSTILELLSSLDSEEVVIELADPSRAGVILPATQPENEEVLMLIMPVLIND